MRYLLPSCALVGVDPPHGGREGAAAAAVAKGATIHGAMRRRGNVSMSKISKAQQRALEDIHVHGNFGTDVRYATKRAVVMRGWVHESDVAGVPLELTGPGEAAMFQRHDEADAIASTAITSER